MKKITLFCFLIFAVNIYSQTQLLSELEEVDIGGGNWINSSGINYTYENNNLKTETDLSWTGSGWEISGRLTYNYNANNKATEEIYESYDVSNGFEKEDRVVYTYNGNGDLFKIEGYIWDNGAWSIESMSTLTYMGTTLTGGVSEDYDGSVWTNTFQSTVSYEDGNISEIIEEEWNGSTWELDGRDTFTYDGNEISSVKYDNRNGAVWEESFTVTYVLDGNGNRISETETYNGGTTTFVTTYTYDMSALMSSFDNPFADYNGLEYLYEDFPYFNKILSTTGNNYKTTYNYNNVLSASDISNKSEISLEVFPNPSTNYITVKSNLAVDFITVFNAVGSKIISTRDKKININSLPHGIYLVNILLQNGNVATKKIIKN
ncbi:MAG: T9SS type A sorting domain-containing protein [Algibacter sp.]|uniref:T9SS type A sorting domain-containing protein n=1 Tax=Algibacter sp. TaxID=1872428 RepID=UPI002618D363|nr:T9SS type A sorting domain-containing protein [Algibacter sp.]MDG1730304.1 T9SS type A sorting domain-containing protein [Algibacter sp.]MDG2178882.1 T9SS type A sorting domain-containing protein [Algibacter sp.]